METKQLLYQQCEAFLKQRLQSIQQKIKEIEKSLLSETKSSAGDKHETGRAMLQLEREKAGMQLAEVQKESALLSRVNLEQSSKIVHLGSVVRTTQANYFLAISCGLHEINDICFYAISPSTPIGKLLLGKKKGALITFRAQSFTITAIE
ncbi:MAG: 3-oxoacyl-ACP synthase [Flavobacteriaceae bacterium]|nr:3-oxoacyl-ACP synthase [Flavobacteriaceae bacterium]